MPPTATALELAVATWQAQLAPRRLVPVLLLVAPLLLAQWAFERTRWAVAVGVLMCLSFWLLGPWLYRWLVSRSPLPGYIRAARLVLLGLVGLLAVGVIGHMTPQVLGLGPTFLTVWPSLLVAAGLFVVGGWGLGRDIDLEEQLDVASCRAEEAGRQAEQAQLLALRAHLDPHFLFNTLNAIAEWCRQDGKIAEQAILRLSSMLRTVLDGVRAERWPLAREIELTTTLFDLYHVRDAKRFTVELKVVDPLPPVMVPPMILLPLAENAMTHGPEAGHNGTVRLTVFARDHRLTVRIENPGPFQGPRNGGHGLDMIRRRLVLAYGDAATLSITGKEGVTTAEVTVPMEIAS